MVVGGIERVLEINRNFRNEGLSPRHNPEFTMLEFYAAYADYRDLIDLTETMLRELTLAVLGDSVVEYQGKRYDFGQTYPRMTVVEAILAFNPDVSLAELQTDEGARAAAARLNVPLEAGYGRGKVLVEIFEKTAEPKLEGPLFITQYHQVLKHCAMQVGIENNDVLEVRPRTAAELKKIEQRVRE